MDDSIESAIDPKDAVLWRGRPNPGVSNLNISLMIAVALGIGLYLYFQYGSNPLGNTALTGKAGAYLIAGIAAFLALIGHYGNSKAEFAITKNKVILKTGTAGTRFEYIDLANIKEVSVTVGFLQSRFSSGTLSIDSGKTRTVTSRGQYRNDSFGRRTFFPGVAEIRPVIDQLTDIDNPHDVHRILMDAIEKRKTEPGTKKTA